MSSAIFLAKAKEIVDISGIQPTRTTWNVITIWVIGRVGLGTIPSWPVDYQHGLQFLSTYLSAKDIDGWRRDRGMNIILPRPYTSQLV